MKVEYEIKGIKLDMDEMREIKNFYEAHCTAEYILENYDTSEKTAIEIGYEARMLMDKYGYTERMAISEVVSNRQIQKNVNLDSFEVKKKIFQADGLSAEDAQKAIAAGCKIYTMDDMRVKILQLPECSLRSDLQVMATFKAPLPDWSFLKYNNKEYFICYENNQNIDFEINKNQNLTQALTPKQDQGVGMTM